jgi:acylphosphatase
MSAVMKNIYATITDHVQMVGYREIVEAHGRARGLAGIVFNDVDGSVKIMARGPEPVLSEFIQDLRSDRPDTTIETIEIMEDISLPSPFGKIAVDDIREYMARFDKGIEILTEHTRLLNENNYKLDKLDKLDMLDGISNKLDTLPERIAEAMKR